MQAHVFDTHVIAKDGSLLHFDVITPERNLPQAIAYARQWLSALNIEVERVSSHECRYCHQEEANEQIREAFTRFGYYIYAMEGFEPWLQKAAVAS